MDSLKKYLADAEDKNKNYTCTIAKHEQSISILRGNHNIKVEPVM